MKPKNKGGCWSFLKPVYSRLSYSGSTDWLIMEYISITCPNVRSPTLKYLCLLLVLVHRFFSEYQMARSALYNDYVTPSRAQNKLRESEHIQHKKESTEKERTKEKNEHSDLVAELHWTSSSSFVSGLPNKPIENRLIQSKLRVTLVPPRATLAERVLQKSFSGWSALNERNLGRLKHQCYNCILKRAWIA